MFTTSVLQDLCLLVWYQIASMAGPAIAIGFLGRQLSHIASRAEREAAALQIQLEKERAAAEEHNNDQAFIKAPYEVYRLITREVGVVDWLILARTCESSSI